MVKKLVFLSVLMLLFVAIFSSCSSLKSLKKFEGLHIETAIEELGKPTSIIPSSGGKIYIFEKTTELRGTEIDQGQGTLDPMLSPATIKHERIILSVVDGIVTKADKEVEYTRK